MSCNHPRYAIKTPVRTETGRFKHVMSGSPYVSLASAERQLKCHIPYDPSMMELMNGDIVFTDVFEIPCGSCIGCRLDYARSWAIRLVLEASCYDFNYFVTLTFDELNCPEDVKKDDVTDFMRKVRSTYGEDIKFFASGEYGERSGRPHYHICLFNMPMLKDLELVNPRGENSLFVSKSLSELWPFGIAKIGMVTFHSCGYVARYLLKQPKNGKVGFLHMSRRPGLGFTYFQAHKEQIMKDKAVYGQFGSSFCAPIPKYFLKLIDKFDPDWVEDYKIEQRSKADSLRYNDLSLFNLADPSLVGLYKDNQMRTKCNYSVKEF